MAKHVIDLGLVIVLVKSSAELVGRTTAVMQTEVYDVLGHPVRYLQFCRRIRQISVVGHQVLRGLHIVMNHEK